MSSADGAKTSKTSRPPGPEQRAGGAERLEPLRVGGEVQIRAERTRDERHAPVHGRPPQVTEAQVEPRLDARLAAALGADREHPGEESTPITCTPASAVGIAILPVPTPSSTTAPPEASASST